MNPHENVVLKPFIDESGIRRRVEELAHEIGDDFRGNEIVLVGALKGSFMFAADLVRHLHRHRIPMVIDFVQVSSYGSKTVSSGQISMTRDLTIDITDRCVLLVDDIADTGRTSEFLTGHILAKKPRILKTVVFLDKPGRRAVPFVPDYAGFRVPDAFIVGYGLDYDNRYREHPYLSLVSFRDIKTGSSFAFWIVNEVIFLQGRLDASGAAWIRETLVHWKGDLKLNLSELDGIGPEGMELLKQLNKTAVRSDHQVLMYGIPEKLRDKFIREGLGKQMDGV